MPRKLLVALAVLVAADALITAVYTVVWSAVIP